MAQQATKHHGECSIAWPRCLRRSRPADRDNLSKCNFRQHGWRFLKWKKTLGHCDEGNVNEGQARAAPFKARLSPSTRNKRNVDTVNVSRSRRARMGKVGKPPSRLPRPPRPSHCIHSFSTLGL